MTRYFRHVFVANFDNDEDFVECNVIKLTPGQTDENGNPLPDCRFSPQYIEMNKSGKILFCIRDKNSQIVKTDTYTYGNTTLKFQNIMHSDEDLFIDETDESPYSSVSSISFPGDDDDDDYDHWR